MGEGPERGRVKIGKYFEKNFTAQLQLVSIALLLKNKYSMLSIFMLLLSSAHVFAEVCSFATQKLFGCQSREQQ